MQSNLKNVKGNIEFQMLILITPKRKPTQKHQFKNSSRKNSAVLVGHSGGGKSTIMNMICVSTTHNLAV